MTLVQTRANGFETPSLPQLLLTAMLRVLAELVLNLASTLQMIRRRSHVNVTRAAPPVLPRETSDTSKEQLAVQPDSPKALMLSSTQSVRPSKHERVLTTRATPTESFSGSPRESRLAHHRDCELTVPLIPATAGTQGETCSLFRLEASIPCKTHHRSWIPAVAGMSGDARKPAP